MYYINQNLLFDFLFYNCYPLSLRVLEAVGCTSKVTEHVVPSVMEKNIFHLYKEEKMRRQQLMSSK